MKYAIKQATHDARSTRPSSTTPQMILSVIVKSQYGSTVYHPADENAKTLAEIAGTKTLTMQTLQLAKKLGYEILAMHEASGL